MQNLSGVIKAITVILIVVCLYEISYTFLARNTEKKADEYAASLVKAIPPLDATPAQLVEFRDSVESIKKQHKRNYLDSVAGIPPFELFGLEEYFTYKFAREHALNLGLDLKGGMSLIMEIAEDDVLRNLSHNSNNAQFNKALENANEKKKNDQRHFLDIFKTEFEALNKDARLAAVFTPVDAYRDEIGVNSTNDEVIKVLRKDFDAAIKHTFTILKTRIDQFGVAAPVISLQEGTGRIILELPGVDDPVRIRKLLQQTAQLEFWDTYETCEVFSGLAEINTLMRAEKTTVAASLDTALTPKVDTTSSSAGAAMFGASKTGTDTSKGAVAKEDTTGTDEFPFWKIFYPNVIDDGRNIGEGPRVGSAFGKDTAKINRLLAKESVRKLLPRNIKLLWSAHPETKSGNVFGLYAIRPNPNSTEAPLTGEAIKSANSGFDQITGQPKVNISMNPEGASKWERLTDLAVKGKACGREVKKCIAIVLDNRVFSAPRVQQKISGGNSEITGISNVEEAVDLANILQSGKLEAKTTVIEEQIIGPSLGKESIKAGLTSLLLGFVMVFVFMILYYSTSGIIANTAMALNMFFLVSYMISHGASFTLPAMAGILLTLAMAVDANVIINERVREEVRRGKGLRLAVDEGYQHSYSAIIDGNLTTMIIGIVLTIYGLGPIQGFGYVLVWGLITSMFTAVVVSRVFFDFAFNRGWNIKFGNKFTFNLLKNISFDFIGKRKYSYSFSALVFTIAFASMIFYGFDFGVDFKGGRSYVVQFDKDVTTEQVSKALESNLGITPIVKTYGSNNQVSITTSFMIDSTSGPATDSIVERAIYEGSKSIFVEQPSFENFRTKNVKSSIKIGATIADDIRQSALWALLFSLSGVFVYIFIRFRKWEFATGAIVALIHDPILVLGTFSLFRHVMPFSLEIDQNVVAAVLTLIGYSVNDTVVVFDRIRETIGLHPTRTVTQNVNDSINQTLSRTVMTVFTVFIVALILFLFGGTPIRGFSFALIIGLLIGTYSSIFVASPVVVDLMNRRKKTTA